jgi:hypothetical protein
MDAGSIVNIGLYAAYALVLIALAGVIILPLVQAFGKPKMLLKSGIGLAVLAILYAIAWSVSSNEVTQIYENFGVNASISQIVGGTLILSYILMIILVLGLIYSEISKIFK